MATAAVRWSGVDEVGRRSGPGATVTNGDKVEQAAREAAPWVVKLARYGFAMRGLMYAMIGLLALNLAVGAATAAPSPTGALTSIAVQPLGRVLLGFVVAGLGGYGVWGFIRAFLDPQGRGAGPRGIAQRVNYALSGVTYLLLIVPAVRLMTAGPAGDGESDAAQRSAAWLLEQPFGRWLVLLLGASTLGVAAGQLFEAATAAFEKDFDTRVMHAAERRWATWLGRGGLVARGLVFGLIGFFMVQAGYYADPDRAKDLGPALASLMQQLFGAGVLFGVGVGLIAFGAFSCGCARWIRVDADLRAEGSRAD